MKKATHTPGPWRILPDEPSGKGERRGPSICGVTTAFSQICIHAEPDGKPCPDVATLDAIGEANARLIAAAPDLLEAAKNVCGLLFSLENVPDDHPAYQALKVVIAKATGK